MLVKLRDLLRVVKCKSLSRVAGRHRSLSSCVTHRSSLGKHIFWYKSHNVVNEVNKVVYLKFPLFNFFQIPI